MGRHGFARNQRGAEGHASDRAVVSSAIRLPAAAARSGAVTKPISTVSS
jgi:hypothetical protein